MLHIPLLYLSNHINDHTYIGIWIYAPWFVIVQDHPLCPPYSKSATTHPHICRHPLLDLCIYPNSPALTTLVLWHCCIAAYAIPP